MGNDPKKGGGRRKVRVTVSPKKAQANRVRPGPKGISCVRLGDADFAFGKSFIKPHALYQLRKTLEARRAELERLEKWSLTIFGHADDVGSDTFNKALSQRRARALYALIMRDPRAWEEIAKKERWGVIFYRVIQLTIGGDLKAKVDPRIARYGKKDGKAQKLRADLFKKYMNSDQFAVDPGGILAGHFTEPPHVGCGEYNLAMKVKRAGLSRAQHRARNQVNRRVILIFWRGKGPSPSSWPPCAKANCVAKKAVLRDNRGLHFRCKFYYDAFNLHRCEVVVKPKPISGEVTVVSRDEKRPVRGAEVLLLHGLKKPRKTNAAGKLIVHDVPPGSNTMAAWKTRTRSGARTPNVYMGQSKEFKVKPAGVTKVTIELPFIGTSMAHILVVNENDKPIPGAMVSCEPVHVTRGELLGGQMATTDSTGFVTFKYLLAPYGANPKWTVDYRLKAAHGGSISQDQILKIDQQSAIYTSKAKPPAPWAPTLVINKKRRLFRRICG